MEAERSASPALSVAFDFGLRRTSLVPPQGRPGREGWRAEPIRSASAQRQNPDHLHDPSEPTQTDALLTPIFEADGLASHPLPARLAELHGGDLGFGSARLFANFVTSLDGITAIDPQAAGQGRIISGGPASDRFLMGLLRAFADVVLIGAGTLRAEPDHVWTPARVFPDAAADFGALRADLGLREHPRLAVVSASAAVDLELPALAGGFVIANQEAAERARPRAPAGVTILSAGAMPHLDPVEIVAALRAEGVGRILTEGGPHLFGQLLGAKLIDELFLTVSPVLAGRTSGRSQIGLVEGTALLPDAGAWGRLLSVRRSESHLFLRYRLGSCG